MSLVVQFLHYEWTQSDGQGLTVHRFSAWSLSLSLHTIKSLKFWCIPLTCAYWLTYFSGDSSSEETGAGSYGHCTVSCPAKAVLVMCSADNVDHAKLWQYRILCLRIAGVWRKVLFKSLRKDWPSRWALLMYLCIHNDSVSTVTRKPVVILQVVAASQQY